MVNLQGDYRCEIRQCVTQLSTQIYTIKSSTPEKEEEKHRSDNQIKSSATEKIKKQHSTTSHIHGGDIRCRAANTLPVFDAGVAAIRNPSRQRRGSIISHCLPNCYTAVANYKQSFFGPLLIFGLLNYECLLEFSICVLSSSLVRRNSFVSL